ncbi:MAG: hypothetical protein ACK2UW_03045 [Anaerolineales bacterium]|jgi:hypothetical protein
MKIWKPLIGAFLLLVFFLSAGINPALAAAEPSSACHTAEFYVYNGTDWLIDFESSNLTPGAFPYTWYGYLAPGEAARYTLAAGTIELYASEALGGTWYLDEMVDLSACSRIAVYVKLVNDTPTLKLKILPGG